MRLFENLPKNSVSVERAKVSTTKYDNPDIAPNTVINSLEHPYKNHRNYELHHRFGSVKPSDKNRSETEWGADYV